MPRYPIHLFVVAAAFSQNNIMSYFTIEEIENILFNGIKYQLSPVIMEHIRQIESELHPTLIQESNVYASEKDTLTSLSSSSGYKKEMNLPHGNRREEYGSSQYFSGHSAGSGSVEKKHEKGRNLYDKPYDKKKGGGGGHHKKTGEHTKSNYGNANTNNSNKNFTNRNITDNDWEILRTFSSTKIATANEGVDKNINEIRVLLNKISDKNYDTYSDKVINSIDEFMKTTEDAESITKLSNAVFEIISKNKYFSELYAKLYVRLIVIHPVFANILDRYLFHFKEKIHSIKYIDPDKDYDGFCENTKINDIRKASLTFIMNLYKLGIVDIEKIHEMTYFLLTLTLSYIDEPDKSNIVEEITENLFIIITMGISLFMENEIWKSTIYPMIVQISTMKAKDHVSLTNRTVFKYMDIIDTMDI